MRYLVTGAAGFVGANLIDRLKDEGHQVRAVDIKTTPHRAHLYEQADEFVIMDLRERAAALRACLDVDHVYHLAADHGGMGYLTGHIDFKVARNNLLIDRNILEAALTRRVDRLLFAGSACGYPIDLQDHDGRALREGDWGRAPAQGLYGEAKRMSALMFEGARDLGLLDARTAIFHQLYGPTQDWEEPRAKFPPAICRKLLEDPDRVEIWGDGSQVRTFIFITDALGPHPDDHARALPGPGEPRVRRDRHRPAVRAVARRGRRRSPRVGACRRADRRPVPHLRQHRLESAVRPG